MRAVRTALAARMEHPLSDVPELIAALPLADLHKSLSCLVGTYPHDFVLRVAALHCLQIQGKARLQPRERDVALYWLPEDYRDATLTNLRDGGFLQFHPERGWSFTERGSDLYQLCLLLLEAGHHGTLGFGDALFRMLQKLQSDPAKAMQSLRHRMMEVEAGLLDALQSRSSHRIRDQARRGEAAIRLGAQVLSEAKRYASDTKLVGDVQALYAAHSSMQVACHRVREMHSETMRAFVSLPEGYTPHDITGSLMAADVASVANVGRRALQPFLVPRPCIREDMLAASADAFLSHERRKAPEMPPPLVFSIVLAPAENVMPASFRRLLERLETLGLDDVALIDFLGEEDSQTALHWFFALDLLSEQALPGSRIKIPRMDWELHAGTGSLVTRDRGSVQLMSDVRLVRRKP